MKRFRSPIWLVFLLGLPFITPFLKWTDVACTHDGHLHYHRVAAMKHAWQNGLYFSRWLPDLAFGYGYPFFLYREPVPLYLTLFPHLAGLPLPTAGNLFYAACILCGGIFTFYWVRDIFGSRSGIVAAVAYMSAPYLLVDALIRGNQPESIALALFPLLLWAGRRYLLRGNRLWFGVAVLSLAFFSLSHNISLLLFTPFLGVYLLLVGTVSQLEWRTILTRLTLFFACGLGMTMFYPGSALLEMDAVTLSLSTTTRNNDFRFNFATLAEIFGPVVPSDPNLLNPPLYFRLGWVPVGLAIFGLTRYFYRKRKQSIANDGAIREQTLHVWFMIGSALFFLFMSLNWSFWLWENLPLIDFVQFPWRMVGRAALPVAFLAGVGFSDRLTKEKKKKQSTENSQLTTINDGSPEYRIPNTDYRRTGLLLTAIIALFLETAPNLYPRVCEEAPFPTILSVFEYEHVTGLVGVDPEGSYFPQTVRTRPSGSPLEGDYAAGVTPRRLDQNSFPAGVTVENLVYGNNRASFDINASQPFTARYFSFAFPGWRVAVDGEPVPIVPSKPEGLITFELPAGQYSVDLRFGMTPLRLTLAIGSALFALFFIYLLWRNQFVQEPHDHKTASKIPIQFGWQLAIVGLFLFGFKIGFVDDNVTPLRFPWRFHSEIDNNLLAAQLELIDIVIANQATPADEPIVVDLAWKAQDVPTKRYQTALTLVDENGQRWSEKELFRPRVYEDMPDTVYWLPGQWGWDSWEVMPFSGTPPGRYQVELTVFDRETLAPVRLSHERASAPGNSVIIGNVELIAPVAPPAFEPQYPSDAEIAPGLKLVGYNLDREVAQPREKMLVTLFLEKTGEINAADNQITLNFAGANGSELVPIEPGTPAYRPSDWPVGTRIRTQDFTPVPAAIDETGYSLSLTNSIPLRPIEVVQIDRLFDPPPVDRVLDQPWETAIALHGYSLNRTEEVIDVELVWQATGLTEAGIRVFVHGLDGAGDIVTQSDGVPAAWARPTEGWLTGEYIVDQHTLPLAGGSQVEALRIGLYRPDTGLRLPLGDGRDGLMLTDFE